ncbi:MAG TPA: hypothetical protein DEF48_18115 [Nostoc sp. UBA8866]|nr:hypothetical protein DSM107007_43610 [Nostoc sp. PCC 7120 = FACHB-418]BAB74462.1 asr2763 [Nostoc sp. PCC 7120 = FACHB-418]HBW31947.1 hypothetical protein [Nostoc sp. UBA8866]
MEFPAAFINNNTLAEYSDSGIVNNYMFIPKFGSSEFKDNGQYLISGNPANHVLTSVSLLWGN